MIGGTLRVADDESLELKYFPTDELPDLRRYTACASNKPWQNNRARPFGTGIMARRLVLSRTHRRSQVSHAGGFAVDRSCSEAS